MDAKIKGGKSTHPHFQENFVGRKVTEIPKV
jgi:hypothetical protein